jgi:hypothetical protein
LIQRGHFGLVEGLAVDQSELVDLQIVNLIHILGEFLHQRPDLVVVVVLEHLQLGDQRQFIQQFAMLLGQIDNEG